MGVELCSEARRECGLLQCPYGIEKYVDADSCERCRCHDPCRDQYCADGFRCAVDLYRDDSGLVQAKAVCREGEGVKSPTCSRAEPVSNYSTDVVYPLKEGWWKSD